MTGLPEATITADVASIRANLAQEFRNHGDATLHTAETSTGERLADELAKNRPDADARVLRVLAARIARAGTANEDPLLTLADLASAARSLATAAGALAGQALSDDDGRDALATYRTTLNHLRDAADGLADMAGWF